MGSRPGPSELLTLADTIGSLIFIWRLSVSEIGDFCGTLKTAWQVEIFFAYWDCSESTAQCGRQTGTGEPADSGGQWAGKGTSVWAGNAAAPAQCCGFCRAGLELEEEGHSRSRWLKSWEPAQCGWSSVMLGEFYQVKSKSWVGHITRTNNLKICMETQKNFISQKQSWERRTDQEVSYTLNSDYSTKLQ